jgi:hypothetical protein
VIIAVSNGDLHLEIEQGFPYNDNNIMRIKTVSVYSNNKQTQSFYQIDIEPYYSYSHFNPTISGYYIDVRYIVNNIRRKLMILDVWENDGVDHKIESNKLKSIIDSYVLNQNGGN